MEGSNSATSQSRSKATKNNADENIALSFGNLRLSSDNVSTVAAHPPPYSSQESQETEVVNQEEKGLSQKLDNLRFTQEFTPSGTGWPSSSSSLPPNQNIWAAQNFYNGETAPTENRLYGQGSSATPLNYAYMNYLQGNSCASLRGQTSFSSFHPNSSIYRSPTQFGGYSALNYPSGLHNLGVNVMSGTGNFSPVMENQEVLVNTGSSKGNYRATSPFLQGAKIWGYSSPLESSLPGFNFFAMAMNKQGSEQLRRVLRQGNSWYIQETLRAVFPYIFQLMNDFNGRRAFDALVERCENCQLRAIVMKLQSESDLFLSSTFHEIGSRSIQRLIKRLKKTGVESIITAMLSTRFYELIMDMTATHVIQHSFEYLGDEANQVLHDQLLSCFLPLATDRVGCLTVNVCIDNITGLRRAVLIDLVADNANYLANDPSGNYVLQRVLGLKNGPISWKICSNLRGQYVELAQRKSGSHVVEKCLESSELGLSIVIKEIFANDKTIFLLARDEYGNYVIQAVLRFAKKHAGDIYQALLNALKPHYSTLQHKPRGKYVCNLIKADIELLLSPKSGQ